MKKLARSRSEKPTIHTTKNGERYVRPSDIVLSTSGRAIIESHAARLEKKKQMNKAMEILQKIVQECPECTARYKNSLKEAGLELDDQGQVR